MFKCQFCGRQTEKKEPMRRFTVETRLVTYPRREKVKLLADGTFKDDPGGEGWEIVKEKVACQVCANEKDQLALAAGAI